LASIFPTLAGAFETEVLITGASKTIKKNKKRKSLEKPQNLQKNLVKGTISLPKKRPQEPYS